MTEAPFQRQWHTTADGSQTLWIPEWDESYHSRHGAVQEALHVFLQHGYQAHRAQPLQLLEMGLGTGLNALLTLDAALADGREVHYTGVEAYPLTPTEYQSLDFSAWVQPEAALLYPALMDAPWERPVALHPLFTLHKCLSRFESFQAQAAFDLIYYDAFGYRVQPELWSEAMMQAMYEALRPGGILTTYACRKPIIDHLKAAGFTVQKKPGPPGKREMLMAFK